MTGPRAEDILAAAREAVTGPRAETHGDMAGTFGMAAALWGAYLGRPLTGPDVALLMALLKVARACNGTVHADDYVDAAGYAACAGQMALRDGKVAGFPRGEPTTPPAR